MPCPTCGAPQAISSELCQQCTSTVFDIQPPAVPAGPVEWEYRELAIRLGTREGPAGPRRRPWWETRQYRHAVEERVQEARREGWDVDGPLNWESLALACRARYGPPEGHSRLRQERVEEFVILRLKRPARAAVPRHP